MFVRCPTYSAFFLVHVSEKGRFGAKIGSFVSCQPFGRHSEAMSNSVVRTAAGERGGASISTGYPDCVCAQNVQKQGDWLTETGRERRTKRKLAKSLPHFLRLLPRFP